jgi:hypothetical protein
MRKIPEKNKSTALTRRTKWTPRLGRTGSNRSSKATKMPRDPIGMPFVLTQALGPFKPGEMLYCIAKESDSLWVLLPREWCGVRQIKLCRKSWHMLVPLT